MLSQLAFVLNIAQRVKHIAHLGLAIVRWWGLQFSL